MAFKPNSDKEAVKLIIDGLEARGVQPVFVFDGGERIPFHNVKEGMEDLMAVDMATLEVKLPNGKMGHILFVFGNDPEEVVCDHTVNLSEFIDPIVTPWWE